MKAIMIHYNTASEAETAYKAYQDHLRGNAISVQAASDGGVIAREE
jgi:hypothetical protein